MGGKHGLGPHQLFVMDILQHGPGDTHAVEGGSAAADLVKDNEAVLGGVLQDIRHLCHLNHKRGLAR